ncbi:MAG: orotidine-5'-phosphate decarboxylase, partial [Sphaerochaetaceae bacterium]
LIPGVGSQGGDAKSIIQTLKDLNYDLRLVRINSSSALTHPWKNSPPPKNWKEVCISSIRSLISECSL